MDYFKYIYIKTTSAIEEVTDEKEIMLQEMFYFIFSFSMKFRSSKYLMVLLKSIIEYYTQHLVEIEREYDIYSSLVNYFEKLDDREIRVLIKDEELLEEYISMLDSIEETVEARILRHSKYYGFYIDLLDKPVLTNSSYKFIKHIDIMTEEKKNKYLSMIPRG